MEVYPKVVLMVGLMALDCFDQMVYPMVYLKKSKELQYVRQTVQLEEVWHTNLQMVLIEPDRFVVYQVALSTELQPMVQLEV